MPLAVIFWFIGWSLFWIGSRKRKVKPVRKPAHEELRFAVLLPEQKYVKQQALAG
jgi:hypothetical protein